MVTSSAVDGSRRMRREAARRVVERSQRLLIAVGRALDEPCESEVVVREEWRGLGS
jgi:hypothetical protein